MRTIVKAQCGVPANNRFFFDDFFGKDFFNYTPGAWKNVPAVNVKENEKDFSLEVAAPGLQKEDFNVEVNDGQLIISAEKKMNNEDEQANESPRYTRKEFSYQSFRRSFTLDEESLDADNISAKYENGVLFVSIPKKVKTEEEKKAKTISVL